MQENTALVEPSSLSVDYPLDYCPRALCSYLALRILRPSFHILDKDFVKQEGAAPDDSGSSAPIADIDGDALVLHPPYTPPLPFNSLTDDTCATCVYSPQNSSVMSSCGYSSAGVQG